MKPTEPTRLPVEHHRERAEPGPLLAGGDQALLHPVGKDVSNPPKQRLLVEDRLRGVAPFPEGAPPADDRADLLRDVRQEVLHELGEFADWGAYEEMDVIRSEHECKDLDPCESRSPSQYSAQDLVCPLGRT